MVESCYCCAFFNRASASWREETEAEGEKRRRKKERKGEEEEECVELKWRILVYISSATTQWKTPLFLWELAQLPAFPLVADRRRLCACTRRKADEGSQCNV